MPPAGAATASASSTAPAPPKKTPGVPEKKYKCQFCSRAFSRSEHRSRHERSHTKERPFKCQKCKSTFVRRDLLLRHDRTVHAKDGGVPLVSEVKRKQNAKAAAAAAAAAAVVNAINVSTTANTHNQGAAGVATVGASKPPMLDTTTTLEQIEQTVDSSDGMIDLETAAMLITDLHHKAAMSANNHHHHHHHHHHAVPASSAVVAPNVHRDDVDGPQTPYSPDHTQMFDNGPYHLSSAALPQMPWDQFMSHPVNKPKKPSIASSITGSQDSEHQLSQLSFNSAAAAVQPTAPPVAPMGSIDRFPSSSVGDALAPALPGMPGSGIDTPNGRGLSPFPFLMGPYSPVDYRRSPGPSQALTSAKTPQVNSDEDYEYIVRSVAEFDGEPTDVKLPNRKDVNDFLSTYFNLFHHHLPFLHPESFNPTDVSPPLLLAVMSIGALYTFNQAQAYGLHIGSKLLVNLFLQNRENYSSRKCPLWAMQSTLLNMIFTSWSGDPKGLEWACSIKSLLATMVSGNRYELRLRVAAREGRHPSHAEWIEDEGCRRTYYAVYIFFGLLTLTYNHSPGMDFEEFEDVELPSSESLWNLENADDEVWRESLEASQITTAREAHDSLFQGEAQRYSAYATRIMVNALFLEVWAHKRSFEALQDVVLEYKLRLALETWEKSLESCEPETIVIQLSAPHKGHPLIFNAMAVYRNTRARLEVDLKPVQEALRYHDPFEVAGAMTTAQDKVKRSLEMNKVIEECIDCLEIVALQGIKWVGRTCATNWSVEHPLCGLDLMVILSLWLFRLEHDEEPASEEELAMYNKVRNLFDEDSVDIYGAKLSSTVARLWGSMLDEVVVWGITKVLGESFKLHSQALSGYEDAVTQNTGNSTPTLGSTANADQLQPPELEMDSTVY